MGQLVKLEKNEKDFHFFVNQLREEFHEDLSAINSLILDRLDSSVPLIQEIASYLMLSGGKRIRPLLTTCCYYMCLPKIESEKKLIGGSGDYDTFSSRFLELKRIGLAELILNAMNNDPIVSVYDGVKHVKKSKIMNKKIGINFFCS